MKYTNILAGAFGLMALAACSNNDEVIVEQPKEVHTITVAYGRGANTRLAIEEKWDDYDMLSFKSSWENTDQIKLVAEDETEYVYSIETINADGTATFTREGKPADGTYKVVYPADWNGSLGGDDDYVYQEKTSLVNTDAFKNYRFDIKDYQQAMAIAECKDGKFAEIALKPIFNFLYIPEGLTIGNMELYDWTNIDGEDLTKKLDNGKIIFDTSIGLTGTNLYKTIKNYAGVDTGSLWIRSNGKYESWPVYYDSESKKWRFEHGTIVAFPVLPGQEPVKNLQLWFYEIPCNLMDYGTYGNDFPFYEGGTVYYLEDFNLVFPEPEVEPEVGRIIGSDGKYYKTTADVPTGVTPEAMVGKWNTGDGYGYAIALEDASDELLSAEVAGGFIYNNDYEWCRNHAIDGDYSDWSTPQISIFNAMINDCGGLDQFNALLEAAGGSKMNAGKYICKDSTYPNYYVYDFVNNKSEVVSGDTQVYVRAYYRIQ